MRSTDKTVTFARPFVLGGLDHPAGAYVVTTDHEDFDTPSYSGSRRVETRIAVPVSAGSVEMRTVDPVELEVALLRDAGVAA